MSLSTKAASPASTETVSKFRDTSSIKRKHEDADNETSAKKRRKQKAETTPEQAAGLLKERVEGSIDKEKNKDKSEKKRQKEQRRDTHEETVQPETVAGEGEEKKKRKKEKHRDADQQIEPPRNGSREDQDIDLQDALQQESLPADTAVPSSLEKETRKKTKKSKGIENPVTPPTNSTAVDEDLELSDAPMVPVPQVSISPAPSEADVEPETAVEDSLQTEERSLGVDILDSPDPSCFYSTRLSLYVSVPAITLPEHAKKAILSMHLAPLLLTYFPPAKGIVMAFEDASLCAKAGSTINLPLKSPTEGEAVAQRDESTYKEIMAQASDQFGAAWVWLTVTLLVFRPQKGDELYGWNNVASEGFVGLVSYNYFQTAVGASRIPKEWKWRGPVNEQRLKKKRRKEKMLEDGRRSQSSPVAPSSVVADEQTGEDIESQTGFFHESGERVAETLKYRVVDTEMVPGGEKGKWSMQIEATLLDEESEKKVVDEERMKWERIRDRQSATPALEMSGGLRGSREASVMSSLGPVQGHRAV